MALTENINYIIEAAFPIVESGLTFEHADGNIYEIMLPKNEAEELSHDTNVNKRMKQRINERLNLFYKEAENIITIGDRENIIYLKVELQSAISHYEKVCFDNYTLMTLIKGIDEKIKVENLFVKNPILYQELIKDRCKYVPYYRRLRWAKIFSDRIKEVCEKIEEVLLPQPAEAAPVVEGKLSHPQIALFHIYTQNPITKNNCQQIAEKYGQTSGQKLHKEYNKLSQSSINRTYPKNAITNIETVLELLTEPVQIKRANDELIIAKRNKNID